MAIAASAAGSMSAKWDINMELNCLRENVFWIWSGEKMLNAVKFGAVPQCADLVELEKMLQHQRAHAKNGFDTAEDEPAEIWKQLTRVLQLGAAFFAF